MRLMLFMLLLCSLACNLSRQTAAPPSPQATLTPTESSATLYGIPLDINVPLDSCSVLNQSTTTIPIRAQPENDAAQVKLLAPNAYVAVVARSANGWFYHDLVSAQGWVDGSQIELFGDCIDIAQASDNYTPPPFLNFAWVNRCRFVPDLDIALQDASLGLMNVTAGQEYVITDQDATRYLLALGDAVGGWVPKGAGQLRGDCSAWE